MTTLTAKRIQAAAAALGLDGTVYEARVVDGRIELRTPFAIFYWPVEGPATDDSRRPPAASRQRSSASRRRSAVRRRRSQ